MTTTLLNHAQAEGGDEFLDGIGETALISRYIFNGNLEDWSRNGLDASVSGTGYAFVADKTFGKVLSLPGGENGAFIQVPTVALDDAVSFSVTGWVNLSQKKPGQTLFDLGTDASRHLGLFPLGQKRGGSCEVSFSSDDAAEKKGLSTFSIRPDSWAHLAVVMDAAEKSICLYVDGQKVAHEAGLPLSASSFLDLDHPDINKLYLGRSIADDGMRFGGLLHDIRIYRRALSAQQIEVIRHNAVSDEKITAGSEDFAVAGSEKETPEIIYPDLEGVPNVTIETKVGYLPKLPYYLPGRYKDDAEGPKVRVLWPAPEDNRAVAQSGTYTLEGKVPGTSFLTTATVRVVQAYSCPHSPTPDLQPLPLGQVVLLPNTKGEPTQFMTHRDTFFDGLAASNPDRFLYVFRDAFGEKQPDGATPLGGWESPTTRVRGQSTGHYLSALAQAYASTSYNKKLQAEFGQKMEYMVDVLHRLSRMSGNPTKKGGSFTADSTKIPVGPGKKAYDSDFSKEGMRHDYWNWGEGFISGYPPDQFIMLEGGATYGGRNDQVWAPYYVLHKILTGLVDCYEVGGNPKALEVANDMGLWAYKRIKALPNETRINMWNRYIAGEYGGMNEIMARLHLVTGDKRFLEAAKLFDNTTFFFGDAEQNHGLAKNVDTIRGRHANQHVPQILGALETYRASGDAPYFQVADHFWRMCEHSYMYSIGGVAGARNPANAECFTAEPDSLFANGLSQGGQNETCATYNLLKLSRGLFIFDQDAGYMDYYERALYNHILASVDENSPANTYHIPLNPGSKKSFGNPQMDRFTCCNGTALESATKLQDTIYFTCTDDRALYVNLYVPSAVNWIAKMVQLVQETDFPYSDHTTLTLKGGGTFPIFLRVPHWAKHGFSVSINGKAQKLETTPGTYLELKRTWKDGDRIVLKMPLDFHLLPLMDQPNIASIFYGPILLAAEEDSPRNTWRTVKLDRNNPGKAINGDPTTLRFHLGETALKPFFAFYRGFHSVYLHIDQETVTE